MIIKNLEQKFIITIISLLATFLPIFAENSWEDMLQFDSNISTQKPVTNQEFNKVIDKLNEKKIKKQEKIQKKLPQPIDGIGSEFSSIQSNLNEPAMLMISSKLISSDGLYHIPIGYYKFIPSKSKDGNHYFINLYQGNTRIAKLNALPSKDDYNQPTINYVKAIENDGVFKIVFGNIDVNLETVLFYEKN